jgi:hypothetical protein
MERKGNPWHCPCNPGHSFTLRHHVAHDVAAVACRRGRPTHRFTVAAVQRERHPQWLSRTIASFCSAVQRRRRSGPVNTSITSCLVLAKNTVLCLPVSLSGRLCPEIQGAAPIHERHVDAAVFDASVVERRCHGKSPTLPVQLQEVVAHHTRFGTRRPRAAAWCVWAASPDSNTQTG